MQVYDAIVWFGVIVMLLVIITNLLKVFKPRNVVRPPAVQQSAVISKKPVPQETLPTLDPIYLPERAGKADKKPVPVDDMISTYYTNARTDVPEQYCYKPIGVCPHSKPMSTDLPLGNVPMCVAVADNNMRLNIKSAKKA
jgi:hypothetical protein